MDQEGMGASVCPHLYEVLAGKPIDEAAQYVLGVLRVALDAQQMISHTERLHRGLIRRGDYLGAAGYLPHLPAAKI